MKEKLKGYKKRLANRRRLAKGFGSAGFYTVSSGENRGIQYPLPLVQLIRMKEAERAENG